MGHARRANRCLIETRPHLNDRRQHPNPHERRLLAIEANVLVVIFGSKHYVSDLAQTHDSVLILFHYQLLELFRGAQIGIRDQVHRDHGALGVTERGKIVVIRECSADCGRRDPQRGHLLWL